MNPQISPWMKINDHQRLSDIKREQQEKNMKHFIQAQYQKQLKDQMQLQRQSKMKQQQRQKQWEREMLQKSIDSNRKLIQLQNKKTQASNQKQLKMDIENQYYNAAKKQKQEYIQQNNRFIQQQINRRADQSQRKQRLYRQYKKKQLINDLKQEMDYKHKYDRYQKEKEKQFENFKIKQKQMLSARQEQQRSDYLRKLKQKAATIDYGSHQAFNNNYQKTLLDRKRQQWRNQKYYVDHARQANKYQQQYQSFKNNVGRAYGDDLKRQISMHEQEKIYSHKKQLEQDRMKIDKYQNFSHSLELNRKNKQNQEKKQLHDYLRKQVEQKQRLNKQGYLMQDREFKMNADLLRGSKTLIPGQTYDLDFYRRKQLETVAKSISNSPVKSDKNYLAERGKNALG